VRASALGGRRRLRHDQRQCRCRCESAVANASVSAGGRRVATSCAGARWRHLHLSLSVSLALCLSVSLSLCLSVFVRGGGVVVWCGGRMHACARACGRARWPPASVVVDWRCCLAGVTWRTACDWVHASPAWAMQSRAGPALAAGKWHAQLKLAREAQVARLWPGLCSCCTLRRKAGWCTVSKQRSFCARPCSTAPAKWAQFGSAECTDCTTRPARSLLVMIVTPGPCRLFPVVTLTSCSRLPNNP
jgi:hypothetical protein